MDAGFFKKMRVKPSSVAIVLYAPPGYPKPEDLDWKEEGPADFIHVFVESRAQFSERFAQALPSFTDSSHIWISYPKSSKAQTYDINRGSLWGLLLNVGFHPVSQVALDETWSAVRVKRNEAGVAYTPPSNIVRSSDSTQEVHDEGH